MKLFFLRVALAITTCAMFLAFAQAVERQAYAYVDPGAGLLVLQSAGSAVMAGLFICRRKIAKLLRHTSQSENAAADRHAE